MYAIATLVMFGDDYIQGAVALANSLRYFTNHDIVCIHTYDVSEDGVDTLRNYYDRVVQVPYIYVYDPGRRGSTAQGIYGRWSNYALTKWNVLNSDYIPYEKVLFLDADMVAVDTVDELFSLPAPASVFDHHLSTHYVEMEEYQGKVQGKGLQNPYRSKHDEYISESTLDRLMEDKGETMIAMNGGIALLEPSKFAYGIMMKEKDDLLGGKTFSGPDELILTMIYHKYGYRWTHIDMRYNVATHHLYEIFKEKAHILHFLFRVKPWHERLEDVRREYPHLYEQMRIWHLMYNDTYIVPRSGWEKALSEIIGTYIGAEYEFLVRKYSYMFKRAITHESVNKASNYEYLEAVGDKYLGGALGQYMSTIPGIVTPDQITTIGNYLGGRETLSDLFNFLNLLPYISVDKYVLKKSGGKIESDIIEALIGAIFHSSYKDGYDAWNIVYIFIYNLYKAFVEIDVRRYKDLYTNAISRMNEYIQDKGLDRDKLHLSDYIITPDRKWIKYVLEYDNREIGEGYASLSGRYFDTAKKKAKQDAYRDALLKGKI